MATDWCDAIIRTFFPEYNNCLSAVVAQYYLIIKSDAAKGDPQFG
jgi:hypothetical protein